MKQTEKIFQNIVNGKKYTDKELALFALGMTEEEVADVIESDKRIDKGEKLFELPEELEKGAKKARMSGNTKGYTREKKVDRHKTQIIETLTRALKDHSPPQSLEIKNPEREFEFVLYGKKYKVVLSCPRT